MTAVETVWAYVARQDVARQDAPYRLVAKPHRFKNRRLPLPVAFGYSG